MTISYVIAEITDKWILNYDHLGVRHYILLVP